MNIKDSGQRRHGLAIDEGVGDRVASGEAAGYRDEVGDHELLRGLLFNQAKDVGDGHALHGVMRAMTAGRRLRVVATMVVGFSSIMVMVVLRQ